MKYERLQECSTWTSKRSDGENPLLDMGPEYDRYGELYAMPVDKNNDQRGEYPKISVEKDKEYEFTFKTITTILMKESEREKLSPEFVQILDQQLEHMRKCILWGRNTLIEVQHQCFDQSEMRQFVQTLAPICYVSIVTRSGLKPKVVRRYAEVLKEPDIKILVAPGYLETFEQSLPTIQSYWKKSDEDIIESIENKDQEAPTEESLTTSEEITTENSELSLETSVEFSTTPEKEEKEISILIPIKKNDDSMDTTSKNTTALHQLSCDEPEEQHSAIEESSEHQHTEPDQDMTFPKEELQYPDLHLEEDPQQLEEYVKEDPQQQEDFTEKDLQYLKQTKSYKEFDREILLEKLQINDRKQRPRFINR